MISTGKIKEATLTASKAAQGIAGARYLPKAWGEFLNESGLTAVRLHQYYLGQAPPLLYGSDYRKLLSELLADAVAVGAIVIPSPYTLADFQLAIQPAPYDVPCVRAEITLKGKPDKKFWHVPRDVADDVPLSAKTVERELSLIFGGVEAAILSV